MERGRFGSGVGSAGVAEYRACEFDGALWERSSSMLEDESCELVGGVFVAGLQPLGRHAECGCESAYCFDARLAAVCFQPADVGVGDAFARELALAEPELEAALMYAVSDGRHLRGDGSALHC